MADLNVLIAFDAATIVERNPNAGYFQWDPFITIENL
jgi:hypothetical protein